MSDKQSPNLPLWRRTIYCGQLRARDTGKEVTLLGWVHKIRDLGNIIFIDLRDREGLVQIVIPARKMELLEEARKIRGEFVIGIRGAVKKREEKSRNPQLATGEIEVEAQELKVFAPAKIPPFVIADPSQAAEELRFKYRYLDLRRLSMQNNIKLRHQAALCVRNFLNQQGFMEIETPFLTKSTPEGARDYLVPSRIYKGRFYALPQSPQLFKQLLMIAGFDRYFQIVRCFRDEDLRADRQPEFTQIDIEMSFVEEEDIFNLIEGLMTSLFKIIGEKIETPFPRLTYRECMEKYGSDKPDLRSPLEIQDITSLGKTLHSEFLRKNISSEGVLKALLLKKKKGLSRTQLEKMIQKAKDLGAKDLFWMKEQDGFKSSLRMEEEDLRRIWAGLQAEEGDVAFLSADEADVALKVLGDIRREIIQEENFPSRFFKFAWVRDSPLFEWSGEERKPVSMHHPFTSPKEEDFHLLEKDPLKAKARAYDLVLNGTEIGGGSIRIHSPELQKKIFEILGLSRAEMEQKFGFLLEALSYGAPPHGGIALGFDRIVMILAGEESIREVIPFPKTTSALCLLTSSPSEADTKQIEDLGLKIIK